MENTNPLISVIIPVYNVKPYLQRCVESVLGQTYSNLELLLVDDGSTDGSAEICDALALRDARVRVHHQNNNGVSSARNKGLGEASGDFISFVDADDWVEADYLENLLNPFLDNRELEVSISNHIEELEEPDPVAPFHKYSHFGFVSTEGQLDDYFNQDGSLIYTCTIWGKLYARSVWEDRRIPSLANHEDRLAYFSIMMEEHPTYLTKASGYHHLRRPTGASFNQGGGISMTRIARFATSMSSSRTWRSIRRKLLIKPLEHVGLTHASVSGKGSAARQLKQLPKEKAFARDTL